LRINSSSAVNLPVAVRSTRFCSQKAFSAAQPSGVRLAS
jgi:hypothetical protein